MIRLSSYFHTSNMVTVAGVLVTIIAAMISFLYVAKNEKAIMRWERDIAMIEARIRDEWKNAEVLGYREDTATMLALFVTTHSKNLPVFAPQLTDQYFAQTQRLAGDSQPRKTPQTPDDWHHALLALQRSVETEKQRVTDHINDAFVEKTELEEKITRLRDDNRSATGIALTLQILGLILVLSNSIAKKIQKMIPDTGFKPL